ncbi:MAG: hypothetical protein J6R29_02935 [Clostridia bacterium]|nr:hypothetical protein [Clostridia bacterium]
MKNNNKNKNLFNAITTVFAWLSFILAIFLAGLTIIASFSDEQNGKSVLGYKILIVNSDSMSLPQNDADEKVHFNAGDVIIIKTAKSNQVFKEGDVITFISKNGNSLGKTLTHKVREVKVDGNGNLIGYVTYGIYTGKNDESLVTPTNIIGVYSCKIPALGTFFAFLKTPGGYFTSILIPCVFLIIFFSIKLGKYVALREVSSVYDVELENLKQRVAVLEKASVVDLASDSAEMAVCVDETENSCETEQENEPLIISESNNLKFSTKSNKVSFLEKLLSLNEQVKEYYSIVYNEFLSYKKVSDRLSFKCVSFRSGKKLLAKVTVRGKTLTLYLALNVNEFNKNVYFQKDASSVKAYNKVPFLVKVKSDRGLKNALTLINTLMLINGIIKKQNYEAVNAIHLLSSNLEEVNNDNLVIPNKYGFLKNVKKVSFTKKISRLNEEVRGYYQTIHNEFNACKKVKERLSFKCLSFNKGRKLLAKITVRGKTLTLYLALNVNEFNKNVYFQKDASSVKAYSNVPFLIKVKSKRGLKNALYLINELMKKNGIE